MISLRILLLVTLVVGLFISAPVTSQSKQDILIGGLFPLHDGYGGAGVERATAFLMAVDQINADPTILPSHRLVPVIANTEADPSIGVAKAEELIQQGVVAIIGPATSRVAVEVAEGPSADSKVPLISYSATSILLDDTDRFPYFARVVPSDFNQAVMLVDLVDYFGWDYVASIGTGDSYSRNVVEVSEGSNPVVGVDVFEQQAKSSGIEIAVSTRVSNFQEDIDLALDDVVDSGSNVIILSTVISDSRRILTRAHERGIDAENGFTWIGTDALAQEQVFTNSTAVREVLQGAIATRPVPGLGQPYEQFLSTWRNCNGANSSIYSLCGSSRPNLFSGYAYDAAFLLARSLDNYIDRMGTVPQGEDLMLELTSTTFTGVTGVIELDDTGNQEGNYEIVNLQGDRFVEVGIWTPASGIEIHGTIYWDGDPTRDATEVPDGIRNPLPVPAFGLISLLLLPLLRKQLKR